MTTVSRWLAPAVLAAGFGFAALAPLPAQAQDDSLTRVLVDVADVVFNAGVPYYRYGDAGYRERLFVGRDRNGRPLYYRQLPYYHRDYRTADRGGPPYGHAYGYWRHGPGSRADACYGYGWCGDRDRDDDYPHHRHHRGRDRDDDRDHRWHDDD